MNARELSQLLLDCLEVAWSNIGTASVDVELPDVIQYADIQAQWETYKYHLVQRMEIDDWLPTSVEIVDLPKDRLTVRPLARLEIAHRLAYDALVVAVAPMIKKAVSGAVYSNRWWIQRNRFLSPIGSWVKMQRAARLFHLRNPRMLLANTDISSFYEHIDVEILVDDMRRLRAPAWALERLEAFLKAFNELSSAWGLPQGSDMSGLLANLYLTTFDAEIRRNRLRYFRYSDDTYIFGQDWNELRNVLIRANGALRHRHLNLAASKTRIVASANILDLLEDKEKDAINYGINSEIPGTEFQVRDLFDRSSKESEPMTRDIKFCLTKFLEFEDDYAVEWLLVNFSRVPHIAREVLVYLDHFSDSRTGVDQAVASLLHSASVAQYPYAQQHLLVFMIRNEVYGKSLVDDSWAILLDQNAETFVREMAARYLGLLGPPGETGRLKQQYQVESNHRVRRSLLVACYESSQCGESWLDTVSRSDEALRVTAQYLQKKPGYIPRPTFERPPWR